MCAMFQKKKRKEEEHSLMETISLTLISINLLSRVTHGQFNKNFIKL